MGIFTKKIRPVIQSEAAECGAVSLSMVLGYYGKFLPLKQIRNDCKVSRDGSRLSNVVAAANSYGMETGVKRSGPDLEGILLPAIVFWKFNHYLVVSRMFKNKVELYDPAYGRKMVSKEEFAKDFSGVVFSLKPGADFEKSGKPQKLSDILGSIIGGYKSTCVYLGILAILINVISIIIPGMVQLFVDNFYVMKEFKTAGQYILAFANVIILQFILLRIQSRILTNFEIRMSECINAQVARKALSLPLSYFDKRSRSALVYKLGASDALCSFVAAQFVTMIIGLFFSMIYLILLFYYSVVLTIVIILLSVALLIASSIMINVSRGLVQSSTNENRHFYSAMVSCLRLFDSMKATAGENESFQRIAEGYVSYSNVNQNSQVIGTMISSLSSLVQPVFQITVISIGGIMIIRGEMTIGMVLAYQSLCLSFFAPLMRMIGQFTQLQSLEPRAREMQDIVDEDEDELAVREETESTSSLLRGDVELKNIVFGYNEGQDPVVRDINVHVEAGKSVAFVGGSGSGKTTILRLLEGLYIPWNGEVLLDGKSLSKLGRDVVAASVAIVSQTPFLFEGTVRDNLSLFRIDVDMQDVIRAAKDACIHDDIIRMPNGYDSLLQENGINISGGQKQRMVIAQALVRNPKVIIMDEATSALDTITEEKLMSNVKARNMTMIVVAHRLSTIRDCDEIVVLDSGTIAERGMHDELMKTEGGIYRNLLTAGGGEET